MTDTDETQQLLSPAQETAMLAGEPQRRAAALAGVREETLSRWVNDSEGQFLQVYAARRADIWKAYETQIATLVDYALGHLEQLMRGPKYSRCGDYDPRVRLAAVQIVLQMAKLLSVGTKIAAFGQVNVGAQQIYVAEFGVGLLLPLPGGRVVWCFDPQDGTSAVRLCPS
jgi:hypothetical protein